MSGFIEGSHRHQATLFPDQLEDYISDDNPVRIVDVYVDELDLSGLGFKTIAADTGRPGYHPSVMLKLYIYGYLNRIQSSRRLERECNRNIELMWLLSKLAPDFKTIADFRKDNGEAIQKTCREFIILCRKLDLFSGALIAIDGSKFKAVNHRDKNFTSAKLKHRLKLIDESIAKYLTQIESADRQDIPTSQITTSRLKDKIDRLKEEVKVLKGIEGELDKQPDKQISLTDPDARSMRSRGNGVVGYNVQASVDANHHIILDHKVTNVGNDRKQLADMALRAKEVAQSDKLSVVADRGYYRGEEILACEQANITTYIPKSQTSGNQAKGLFGRGAFIYDPTTDSYKCPGGHQAIYRFSSEDKPGHIVKRYWPSACINCDLKPKCTSGKYRRISRWEHEKVLDEAEVRLAANPDMMRARRSTVEHPFGTIKAWMGATHFQMQTLKHVSTEISLHVLAYNIKRVMNIIGIKPLMEVMQN